MRRQATEPHLEDGGIYRMRWWARVYRTANFSLGGLDIDNTLEKRRKQSTARPALVLAESTVDPETGNCHRGQFSYSRRNPGRLQPGELAAQAILTQGGQALVIAKPPGQTYQDRGEASSPRPAAGVSASRGSSASGGISTSAGAYRRAPSSTRVASILGIIGRDEGSEGELCAWMS